MAPEPSDSDVVDVDEVLANWLREQQPDARPEVVVFTQSGLCDRLLPFVAKGKVFRLS
jgi:hypothetical protein